MVIESPQSMCLGMWPLWSCCTLLHWLCLSVFLSCSHFGQDNLCSPSDILQLNLRVKRTVETLLSLGARAEESSFVSLSIQLLGFVAFYCALMLTLCVLYYRIFPSSWKCTPGLPLVPALLSPAELFGNFGFLPFCHQSPNPSRQTLCSMLRGAAAAQ